MTARVTIPISDRQLQELEEEVTKEESAERIPHRPRNEEHEEKQKTKRQPQESED